MRLLQASNDKSDGADGSAPFYMIAVYGIFLPKRKIFYKTLDFFDLL